MTEGTVHYILQIRVLTVLGILTHEPGILLLHCSRNVILFHLVRLIQGHDRLLERQRKCPVLSRSIVLV